MFGLYESALGALTWGNILMFLIGGLLIYLGIAKKMEPVLLVPIGFGIFLVNLPFGGMMVYTPEGFPASVPNLNEMLKAVGDGQIGLLNILYAYGIETAHQQKGAGDIYEAAGAQGFQAGGNPFPHSFISRRGIACPKIDTPHRHVYVRQSAAGQRCYRQAGPISRRCLCWRTERTSC